MDRSMVQLINGLIPSLAGPVPLDLADLAGSLLALSRTKISSLRPDEEIARPYACANLACERLKQHLNLPKIESRPPVPPKVYQKLYRYLDSELHTGARRSGRPSSTRESDHPPRIERSNRREGRQKSNQTLLSTRPRKPDKTAADLEPPEWVLPVIRQLCQDLEAPAATPHVFVGVSSILASIHEYSAPVKVNLPSLIIVVCIMTLTRMTGEATPPQEYLRRRAHALKSTRQGLARHGEVIDCSNADIDDCMRQLGEYRWIEMEWFNNIKIGEGIDGPTEADSTNEMEIDADQEPVMIVENGRSDELASVNENYLQPGLGTMMDNKVDYLSEANRRSFERWRELILQKVDALEAGK